MPMFVVNTNVAKGDVPMALLSEATEELAKAMGKPAQVGRNFCNLHTLFQSVHCMCRFALRSLKPRRMRPKAGFSVLLDATASENLLRNYANIILD